VRTLRLLRACWHLVPFDRRAAWITLVPLTFLTVALEGVGALAVYALTSLLADPTAAARLPIVAPLVGLLGVTSNRGAVATVALATALLYLTKNLVGVATVELRSRCVEQATAATATELLRRYLGMPWQLYTQRRSADLIYNADQAVARVYATVLSATLAVATEGLVVSAIAALLVAAAPGATLAASGLLGLAGWIFVRRTRRRARALGGALDAARERALRRLQHALGAAKEIALLGRARFFVDAFAADQAELARVRTQHDVLAELPRLVIETTFVCVALLVVVLANRTGTGASPLPLLSLFAYAGLRIIPSVNRIVWQLNEIRFGLPALERVQRDLDLPYVAPPLATERGALHDRVELDGVTFAYPGAPRPALSGAQVTIRRGESVAIVGPTGAGKSTLLDLLAGLLDPDVGRVLVDGADVRTQRAAWQTCLAYVPQEVFLLDDTLRANVALGVPSPEVDEARVWTAIERAQLAALVAASRDGLDLQLGERGARLSGGERQRVGIARALYGEPDVLLLDEATAALDAQTELELARALDGLPRGTTLVVVAHRLSTVRRCARIVLIEDGRIADDGTWDELLARSARFRALAADGASA
jgi:ABC-type multidrug transport system fused ATPase/permease subunit